MEIVKTANTVFRQSELFSRVTADFEKDGCIKKTISSYILIKIIFEDYMMRNLDNCSQYRLAI